MTSPQSEDSDEMPIALPGGMAFADFRPDYDPDRRLLTCYRPLFEQVCRMLGLDLSHEDCEDPDDNRGFPGVIVFMAMYEHAKDRGEPPIHTLELLLDELCDELGDDCGPDEIPEVVVRQ